MLATSVINGQMSTLDRVVEPKKTSIGIISNDDIFKEIISKRISEQGHASNFLALEQLANGNPQKFYVIDLWNFPQYAHIVNAMEKIREKSPDSELILLEAQTPFYMPQLLPVKASANKNVIPLYERPAPPNSVSDVERTAYESQIRQFVDSTIIGYINKYLLNPSVVKIGGSLFDLYPSRPEVLTSLVGEILRLHHEGYPIILTNGGGPRQDTDKGLSSALGITPNPKTVLESQAETTIQLLGGVAKYIPPSKVRDYVRDDGFRELVSKYIPVVTLVGSSNIPLNQSDTHTLALAELVGSYKVIFAKDVNGVYARDPYKESRQVRRWFSPVRWLSEEGNEFFPTIRASQVLNGVIDRTDKNGDGEHLIETGALFYLNTRTKELRSVQVFDGNKPYLLRDALDAHFRASYKFPGSFILKG